ncbi:MAG: hypothetical protein ABSH19_03235 [Opitutales bacterium]|jgi:hypothetical protein
MIRIPPSLQALAVLLSGKTSRGLFHRRSRRPVFANIADGTHAGAITATANVVFTAKYLLAKADATPGEVDICGVSDVPVGVATDEAFVGDIIAIKLLSAGASTTRMVASGAIAAESMLYTAANGQVQTEPATAGTYYLVGRSLTAATAAGDRLEVEPCLPVRITVVAALRTDTVADLAADVTAALATPGIVKILG